MPQMAKANILDDIANGVSGFFAPVVQLFTGESSVETYAVGDEVAGSAVVDRDSTNDWNTVLTEDGQVSTQNIGRIWTDKSVFTDKYDFQGELAGTSITKAEGSDFLVGLSALSSTSNLKTVTTTTTPLDIVLVLDVSGSMDNEMGEVYTPTYNPSAGYGTYYIQLENGEYTRVRYERGSWGEQGRWYYTTGWNEHHYVTPKTSAADSNPDHVQFYTSQSVSKMDSLKSAANQFIDSVNTMNEAIPEGGEQHRIAIVKYADDSYHYTIGNNRGAGGNREYNYTQVMSDFSTNATDLKDDIDSINAGGATASDYGLTMAQHVFDGGTYQAGWNDNNEGSGTYVGARDEAKKVLIFFTDGEPNHSNGWSDSVAATSVNLAHDMKAAGTTIYTIGVVDGANPDNTTSNLNRYLHGVSSNYKDAAATGRWGDADWDSLDLGTRTPAPEGSTEVPQYYYAAEDSAQLDQVFQDITSSITDEAASGSPIEDVTTTEGETNPGNLTFNDELGAYMEVAGDTMQIVYADQTFTSSSRTSQNIEGGVVYTYPFSGTVHANEAYGDKDANLSGLQIKVTHYDDPAKGDVVEAVIPADLIPMRNYDVDTENDTMTVSSAYPVRLFYSVQVKAEAAEQLADPSSAIYTSDYVKNNTNEGGTGVEFYSNLYTNSNGDGFVGDMTATFKPSNGNRFYYFTANTPLYTSNDGSDAQADRSFINGDNTVYYKDTYWVQTGEMTTDPETQEQIPVAVEKTDYIALSTSDIRNNVRYQNQYGSGAYLPAQTHNEDKIDGLYAAKGETGNPTETAKDTLNPTWVDENISARMGNNGRLALELPGTLAVSKNVAFGGQYGNTGFDATDYTQDKSYDINITLTGENNQPVSGTYKAQVKNAQGVVVSDPTDGYFEITFIDGKATHSIKHGETLYIYGLDAGATYEVTETAPGYGFTVAYDDNAKGTIEINKTSSTTVTNTYTLDSTELTGSTDLKVSKTLNNRDWREGDSFTFQIAADQSTPNAPKPDETTVTIDNTNKDDGASFGNISYSMPGQYVYIISEVVPTEDALTGVTYSRARYRVVVDVKDEGNGTMTATSTMTQIMDDAGNPVADGATIGTHTAAFTNTYRTSNEGGTANLGGTKRFVDETGATTLADWTFEFKLTAVGGYPTNDKPGEPGAEGVTYPIDATEVPMPADAEGTSKTVTLSGGTQVFNFGEMTYDGNDVGKTYVYAITEVTGNNDKMNYDTDTEYVTVTVTEVQDVDVAVINAVADRAATDVVFKNSYTPEAATLTGDTALGGTKTITGRDMLGGESYGFTLEYAGGVDGTTPAGESWVELPNETGMTASVTGAGKGVETTFAFGDITFNHVGTYTFTIKESVPTDEAALGGMTYDNHVGKVTVEVVYSEETDSLFATPTYETQQEGATTGEANKFVNVYESSFNYGTSNSGGLNVSKTLTGRDMIDGEFSFTITAANVDDNPALTDDKLAEDDKNFSNGGANDGVANVMNKLRSITFNQDDAGKTFIYTVAETKGDLANVDYDANVYTVEIKVVDDNDGTMHTETTVKNANGDQVGEVAKWDDQATEGNTVATVAFENTYTPDEAELTKGTDTGLKVTKKVTGAPTDADFTFTLVLTGQPEGSKVGGMDDDGEGNMIATTTVDHNFTADEVAAGTTAEGLFDTLTFDKAGAYTFDVIENEAQGEGAEDSWPAGWKYDTSTRHYTVVVTDENPAHATDENQPLYDGKLYIESVNPSSRNQTFTNSYDHGTVTIGGDAEAALTVEKTVKGWSTDADFHFTFTPVEEEDVDWSTVKIANGADKTAVTENFADGDTHSAKFGEITFNEPGTYKFNVTEDEAHDETADPAGWTYDDSTQTITVTVSETDADGNYDGKLHATVSGPAKFENTYKAGTATVEGGEATFAGTKTIDGRGWLDGETFGFELTKGGVSEGASWDNVTYLPVNAAEGTEPVAFESASATANEKNDGNGTFWFAGTYLFSEPGTYTFNVTEKQHNNADLPEDGTNGMTYDRHVGTITVEVTDNGSGTLQTKVTPGTENASTTFVNSFEGEPYTFGLEDDEKLSGHKTVEDNVGSFQMTDDQFTFVMRAQAEGNPMPNDLTVETDAAGYEFVSVTNKNTDAQAYTADYSFGSITFDHDDLAGVTDDDNDGKISKAFQYNVYENETNMPAGVSAVNSGRTYTITITVTEDLATGEITAEGEAVLLNPGDAENDSATLGNLDFVNKYDAGTITGGIQIFKTLSNRDWQQGDTFTFDVKMTADGVAKNDLPEFNFDNLAGTVADYTEADGELSYNITINPSQSVTGNSYAFGTGVPTYTHEGTYVYTITERDSTVASVAKDSSTYVVTVVIEDVEQDGEHVLNRTATITRDGKPYEGTGRVDFTNTYNASGSVTIEATKTLSGRDLKADEFKFEVTGGYQVEPVSTGKNDGAKEGEAAAINFSSITYQISDLEKWADDSVNTGVTKIDSETGLATYVIEYTVTEDQTGFEDYDITPVGSTSFPVTVTLTDNGDGTMSAKVSYPDGDADFKNSYGDNIPSSDTSKLNVVGEKILNSRDDVTEPLQLTENAFQFTLKGLNGAPMPDGANDENELTVGNKADGTVDFGTIEYTVDNVWGRTPLTRIIGGDEREKTFTYEVTESGTLPGVDNDTESPKTFTVTVHDDGKGTLTVTSDPASAPLFSFTNTYNPDKTDFDPNDAKLGIQVAKNVTGNGTADQLHKDGYDFTMTVKNVTEGAAETDGFTPAGNTATSTDDGTVTFGNITFTEVGTYEVTVSEDLPADDDKATPGIQSGNITYDEHELTYTITVTDDKETGDLVATVVASTVSEGESTFTNVYFDEGDAKDVFFADDPQTEVDGKLVGVGDKLTYTVDWAATKAGTVTVTDKVPAGTTVDQASISKGGVYDATTGTITWTFADQALGATGTVSFSVTVDESAVDYDMVRNSATITVGDHKYTTNTTENPVPEKEETTKPGQIGEGTVLTYRISFTNADGDNASAKVVDTLTKGQAYVEGSASVEPTSVTGSAATGQTLTWDLTGLADNQQVTITFDVTITRDAGASVDNTATVNDHKTNTTTTPYPADDEKDVAFADAPTTSIDGKLVGVGDELVYTIDWAADEDGTVTVTDKIPAGTALVEGSIDNGGTVQDGVITWNLGEKANGDKGTVSFKVTVTEDAVNVDEITNTATITVGNNDPKTTNEVTVDFPKKEVTDTTPDNGLQVGDTLDYTIEWANTSGGVATVTVTDTLPAGLTIDEGTISDGGTYNAETRTITWTLDNRNDGAKGTVSFSATVNEDATTVEDPVNNTATITVGNHEYTTNTTGDGDKPATGSLAVSKTIELTEDQGTEVDANKAFEFTLELKDASGKALTNNYKVEGLEGTDTVTSGSKIELKHGQTATITGLPEGATYTVTETVDADGGYTPDEAAKSGTIVAGEVATAAFVNTYEVEPTADEVPANFSFTKQFLGRAWTEDYAFQFKLTPVDGAPMPEGTAEDGTKTITVNAPDTDGDDTATFDFGNIVYTAAGDYSYTVEELPGTNDGVTYSNNVANVTVHVTDKDAEGATTGKLVASVTNPNGLFVNTYETGDVDVDTVVANGGLQIVKNMTGRAIGEGEFTFEVEGTTPEATAKLAGGEKVIVSTKGSTLEGNTSTETVPVTTGLKFTLDDAGKEFTYNVTEVNGGETIDGVTYDGATHTVRYVATDKGTGTLVVNAYVDGATEPAATYEGVVTRAAAVPVVIEFNNSYDAGETTVGGNADVALTGVKQLANRPLVEGEFTFNVTDAKGNFVTSGTNGADGTIRFGAITYTTEKLNAAAAAGIATRVAGEGKAATYTYVYDVAEDQSGFEANGITAVKPGSSVTVTVTDDGAGKLSATVSYAEGGMVFENIYGNGENGSFTSGLAGNKVLDVESGDNAPDITGKYTFTVSVPEGAPAPERTEAVNDASGNVDFGKIVFTMEDIFGDTGDEVEAPVEAEAEAEADAEAETDVEAQAELEDEPAEATSEPRTKTFTYTVTESGSVEGVTNDANVTRQITYTVTDNGDGTMSVVKTAAAGSASGKDFTFTNTYSVEPTDSSLTGNGGFTIAKTLSSNTGRTLVGGEFAFQLLDAKGNVVAEGTNDANGIVSMPAVSFSAPGTYTYTLVEKAGDAPSMIYDDASYAVVATVTDNGNGTLSVAWNMPDATDGAVSFANTYEADPTNVTFTAAKLLSGRDLTEGEYSFELREGDKVIETVKNAADGTVAFSTITYTEAGEHDYQFVEVKGDAKGITYDETVYTAHVSVTDNAETGALKATVTYGEAGEPVFKNTYKADPSNPITFGATKTLNGRELTAGEFTFELVDANGEVVATATNNADGSVVFPDPVVFSEAGTYTYQVREVLPEDDDANTEGVQRERVTYDETVWTATVTVTDDMQGSLHASVSYGDGASLPSFVNTYVAPPLIPDTGDHTSGVLPAVLAVGGTALVAGSLVCARRRNK